MFHNLQYLSSLLPFFYFTCCFICYFIIINTSFFPIYISVYYLLNVIWNSSVNVESKAQNEIVVAMMCYDAI